MKINQFYQLEILNKVWEGVTIPSEHESCPETSDHVPEEPERPDEVDDGDVNADVLGQVGLGGAYHGHNHSVPKIGQPGWGEVAGQPFFVLWNLHLVNTKVSTQYKFNLWRNVSQSNSSLLIEIFKWNRNRFH